MHPIQPTKVTNKLGDTFIFRELEINDSDALGKFFEDLSFDTKQKFNPHSLTSNYAIYLCNKNIDKTAHYVLVDGVNEIQAYFIIDFNLIPQEQQRYLTFGIELKEDKDVFFAPCIADKHQNTGLSSSIMPIIIKLLFTKGINSLILLGGTQETNTLAISFYEKFGFKRVGGYQTEIYNIDMHLIL